MKTFNLRQFSSLFLISMISISFGQTPLKISDNNCPPPCEDSSFKIWEAVKYTHKEKNLNFRDWSDNRIFSNTFDNCASTLSYTNTEGGYTVQYDSYGRINVYFWDKQFGYKYDRKSTPTKDKITLPSEHHEHVLSELNAQVKLIIQKKEVDAYNKGFAWRENSSRPNSAGTSQKLSNPSSNYHQNSRGTGNVNTGQNYRNNKTNYELNKNYSGGNVTNPSFNPKPQKSAARLSK